MAEDGDKKEPVFTFKGMFSGGRTLRGDLQKVGHWLGLYPDDPHGKLIKNPTPKPTIDPDKTPFGPLQSRPEHFEVGRTEHLASVTDLSAYKKAKEDRKPEGY